MRFRGVLGLALVAGAIPFACVSNGSSTPPGDDAGVQDFDSGQVSPAQDASGAPDASDASLPADSSAPVDSPTGDAPATDGANGAVTVDVTLRGTGVSGITIVSHDATGAVTGTTTTDGTGSASPVVVAGGAVTALTGTAMNPYLVTIFGVEPGDVLHVAEPVPSDFGVSDQVTITSLPASPPANTTQYSAAAGCTQATFAAPPDTLDVYPLDPACVSGGTFPLIVNAEDATGTPLGFVYQNGNAAAPDGGASASVALTGAWNALGSLSIHATNAPSGVSSYVTGVNEVAGGVEVADNQFVVQEEDGGVLSATIATHPGFADTAVALVQLGTNIGNATGTQQIATQLAAPGATGTASFDLSQLLPVIQSATVTTTDPIRPTLSWTPASSLGAAAGTLVVVSFIGNTAPDGGEVGGGWTFVVPSSVTSFQAPALPASAGTWIPPTHPDFTGPFVWSVSADGMTTYAQARASLQALYDIDPNGFTNGVPLLGANGTIRVSQYNPL